MDDLLLILPIAIFTGIMAILFELSWRKQLIPQWLARKFLHITAVGACAITPLFLDSLDILLYIVAGFEILLIYLVGSGALFEENNSRKSWGIALFPIPYLVLLFLFEDERNLIFLPMIILAISDALACIIGIMAAKKYYNLSGDNKSIIGSTTFFLSTSVILFSFWPKTVLSWEIFLAISIIAIVLSGLEALGSRGTDNILVPTGAALLIYQEIHHPFNEVEYFILIFSLIAFVWLVLNLKWLELSGAVSAALLGFFVWRFAGWVFLVPLVWFLLSSSLIGKALNTSNHSDFEKKHGKARDWVQVLSNSWLFLLLTIIAGVLPEFAKSLIINLYAVMAIATADTWASEIGGKLSNNVVYLYNFKKHPKGISGGLSLSGTLAGLAGAMSTALIAYIFGHAENLNEILLITIIGFSGMLFDSILAAFLQQRHHNSKLNIYSDEPREGFIYEKGYRILTNDQVNLISICLALVI